MTAQAPQPPSNAAEALTRLGAFYDGMAQTGMRNLGQIQALGAMARDVKDGDYIPFVIAPVESILAYGGADKRIALIIGENSPEGSFYPSVTERMLHVHAQIDLWNGLLSARQPITIGAVPLLQDIMIFTAHISRIAVYLTTVQARLAADISAASSANPVNAKKQQEKDFADFVSSLPPYMAQFFKCCLDRAHISSILQNLRVGDYTIMEYDITHDGNVINHYRLPPDLAKPYLAHLKKLQAEEAAERNSA